ncbi:MAG: AI-2E family transporter [Lachnospiraceae bacterium oral taxon 082]|nr:AI-2E family transporter [Lachnospiraceae bacterium oral taxon 082]
MNNIKKKYIAYIVVATIIVYATVRYFGTVERYILRVTNTLMPFVAGAMMAYIINILMDAYEDLLLKKFHNKKIIRTVSIVLSIFTFVLVIGLLLGLIIPQLVKIMFSIMYTNPGDIKKIIESISKNNIVDKIADIMNIDINNIDISGYVTKLIHSVMSSVGNILMGVISKISGFFNTVISVFMAVVFAIYILVDKERIALQGDKLLRAFLPSKRDTVIDVLSIFNKSFRNYFISQVKEAIILGVLLYIVMLIVRLPYASSISILVGVTALIPVIGAYAGLFIGALMIITKSFSSMIIFIIVHTVVQQFENNIIYPRVVGSSVGLPGMWVIVAVALGGSLFGIFGVFVAVPVAASLYFILKRETLKRL